MTDVGNDAFDGLIDVVGRIEAHVELVVAQAAPRAHVLVGDDELGIDGLQIPGEVTALKAIAKGQSTADVTVIETAQVHSWWRKRIGEGGGGGEGMR